MSAKLIMQRLWKLNIGWDEEVPNELGSTWEILYNSLDQLGDLAIKRNVNPKNPSQSISLHGFCDASEKGYGACIYVLSRNESGELQSNLLCSKSRVAPLKTLTLPRLELNAALLLSRLISVVKRALRVEIESIHLWSDSTITLCWINTPPSNLRTFVANRVAEIQELTDTTWWYYVPSGDNPADIISRGMSLERLLLQNKWWNGPSWLRSKSEWPTQNRELPEEIPEQKRLVMVSALKQSEAEDLSLQRNKLLRKFSSISKLQRVIAYCFRFADRKLRRTGPISVEELDRALNKIIQWTQEEVFPKEIADLRKEKTVHNKSALIGLRPFMDKTGLMRVGGRLSNARISKEQKHPIILPAKNHITETLLREEHIRLLHCGPQQLLSSIRNKYWPLSGTREVRKVTRKCVPCFRYKPKTQEHLMADLSESSVNTFSKPFEISGVDYAGPLQVRESRRRGRIRTSKGYIAVLTCFATKAVHLELVSDLTTETFLAALRRFVARRGLCSTIYSDNATNFVGAARELEDIYKFLEAHHSELLTTLAAQRINWQFLSPRSPHFGGLWEAAVKSVKRHLYTITKGLFYTFEEYSTLLAEIESVLNSRPLMPVPSDPNEISTLTPSHFLIGKPSSEPVAKNYLETPDNRLARWQHIQKLKQHFWQRWQKEYLHHLQSRTKWHTGSENLRVGTIVLLVDENQAPLQWTLGRVLKVYPGADNIVRVADVKTSKGQFRRSVKKLCALPYEH